MKKLEITIEGGITEETTVINSTDNNKIKAMVIAYIEKIDLNENLFIQITIIS